MNEDVIQHFVLTRFNIATQGRESDLRNRPGWLSRRFDLFENYCLPSMAAQSTDDFSWIIYFDENTPEEYRDRIADAQRVAAFEARFVGITRMSNVAKDVVERVRPGTTRVLTTRLDNDDAVSRDFLAHVRAFASGCPDDTVLNFPDGLALREGSVFTAHDASNPFTSLVEDCEDIQTIWSAQHRDLGKKWHLVQVSAPPVWLQIVHGENVANRIKGRRLRVDEARLAFPALERVQLRPTNQIALLTDNRLAYPLRQLREYTIDVLRPVLRKFR